MLVSLTIIVLVVVVILQLDSGVCNRFQKSSRRCTSCSRPNVLVDSTNLRIRTGCSECRHEWAFRESSFSRVPTFYSYLPVLEKNTYFKYNNCTHSNTTLFVYFLLLFFFLTISFINAQSTHSHDTRKNDFAKFSIEKRTIINIYVWLLLLFQSND